MKFKEKDGQTATVAIQSAEMGMIELCTEKVVDIMNAYTKEKTLGEKLLYTSFFVANMSRFFAQSFKDWQGNRIITEDEVAELLASQAKSWLRQIPETKND